MEVKERVITVLFSSEGGKGRVLAAICWSGWSLVPVTARVRMSFAFSRNSAARTVSEVRPEREITTAATFPDPATTKSGNSNSSDAGMARALWPVSVLQVAAAASAM